MGVGTASGGDEQESNAASSLAPESPAAPHSTPQQSQPAQNMDLLADLFGGSSAPPATQQQQQQQPTSPATSSNTNVLMDLLGGSDTASAPAPSTPPTQSVNNLDPLASLGQAFSPVSPSSPVQRSLGAGSPSPMGSPAAVAATTTTQQPGYQAYSKNGLDINLVPSRDRNNPAIINIQVLFANSGAQGVISSLQFQAAVPRSQKLQMAPASSNVVQPGTTEKQQMRINNPQQVMM